MKKFLEFLLNIVFPLKCLTCKNAKPENFILCESCLKSIKEVSFCCAKCGIPLDINQDYCFDCVNTVLYYDSFFVPFYYEKTIKKLIHVFKYKNRVGAIEAISHFQSFKKIVQKIINKFDIIIPVPIHEKRLYTRGYNQSEIISAFLFKFLNIPVEKNILIRKKDTRALFNLSKQERILELKDAFEIKNKNLIKEKRILLVDDISTTGTTINECSKLLKENLAKSIGVFVISHG